ncbi:MAG TPA: hypothetical protein VIM77_04065 [Mucilaginibacter sp.]
MKNFDIHYAVKDKLFNLNIRSKTDAVIKEGYYSLYRHGVWLANIYKKGKKNYETLSYTGSFRPADLELIGREIDLRS